MGAGKGGWGKLESNIAESGRFFIHIFYLCYLLVSKNNRGTVEMTTKRSAL
jgi:hypothetical protein